MNPYRFRGPRVYIEGEGKLLGEVYPVGRRWGARLPTSTWPLLDPYGKPRTFGTRQEAASALDEASEPNS